MWYDSTISPASHKERRLAPGAAVLAGGGPRGFGAALSPGRRCFRYRYSKNSQANAWLFQCSKKPRRVPPPAGDGRKSNRFSGGVYVGKILCAERASNRPPQADDRGAERSESPLAEKASAFFDSLSSQANAWLFPCVKKPRMAERASAFFAGFTSPAAASRPPPPAAGRPRRSRSGSCGGAGSSCRRRSPETGTGPAPPAGSRRSPPPP